MLAPSSSLTFAQAGLLFDHTSARLEDAKLFTLDHFFLAASTLVNDALKRLARHIAQPQGKPHELIISTVMKARYLVVMVRGKDGLVKINANQDAYGNRVVLCSGMDIALAAAMTVSKAQGRSLPPLAHLKVKVKIYFPTSLADVTLDDTTITSTTIPHIIKTFTRAGGATGKEGPLVVRPLSALLQTHTLQDGIEILHAFRPGKTLSDLGSDGIVFDRVEQVLRLAQSAGIDLLKEAQNL